MANPPLTRDLAIAQLKRYIPDPVRRLDLRDLLDSEIQRVRSRLRERPLSPTKNPVPWREDIDELANRAELLMDLVANGILLDTARDHDDLWVWVIERLMRARRQPRSGEMRSDQWVRQAGIPAFLVLNAASFAAIAVSHDDLFLRLHLEPKCSEQDHYDSATGTTLREVPAWRVLYEYRLFEDPNFNALREVS